MVSCTQFRVWEWRAVGSTVLLKTGFQHVLFSCSRWLLCITLFLSVATVLWKWEVLNNFAENIWPVVLTCLDFSACSYIKINVNSNSLCFVFYLPASPDHPTVHGDPREPPVYSWTGPPHTGCVSAVLCSAGLRIIHEKSLVCRTLNEYFFFFNGKTWHGDGRNFWLKLAFMCSYIKQYSTLTNSKL